MDAMEEIWKEAALPDKTGKLSIIFKGINDLAFLYCSGFVDVEKNTFQSWVDAFASSKKKDGTYIVLHDHWLEKKKFHYEGPVGEPFDPDALEEREYSEEEFLKILNERLIPATIFNKDSGPQMIGNLKLHKKLEKGNLKLDKDVKQALKGILNTYPSPLRILQMRIQAFRNAKGEQVVHSQLDTQKSEFAAGQGAHQIAQARLNEIMKVIKKEEAAAASTAPTISLKDLKKKKPGPGRV